MTQKFFSMFLAPVTLFMLLTALPTMPFAADNLNDATITQQVIAALGPHNEGITVKTVNGNVTLGGMTDSERKKAYVVQRAKKVLGVKSVQDDISYSPMSNQ